MEDELVELIKEELVDHVPISEVRDNLLEKGYSAEDIDDAIGHVTEKVRDLHSSEKNKLTRIFTIKEIFDRIGYGMGSQQFINILFLHTGASIFLIGLFNGLKAIISIILTSFLQEYSKLRTIGKNLISFSGILFGFSFLFIALARSIRSVPLFTFAFLIGSLGVVSYGDLFNNLIWSRIKKENLSHFLLKIATYGVLITGITMLLSGFIMDLIPETGAIFSLTLFGKTFSMKIFGYLLSFEITALMFILSGYMLSSLKDKTQEEDAPIKAFIINHMHKLSYHIHVFFKNKLVLLLLITSLLFGAVQLLGSTYYGIFIYKEFQYLGFGGFLNVAVVFFMAILASFVSPNLTKIVDKEIGMAPMLVFGTMLSALMPLSMAFNPHILTVGIAAIFSVFGSALVGIAQGLLARKIMFEYQRKMYYSSMGILVLIPYLILIPLGSYVAHTFGLPVFFRVLVGITVLLIAPLYFVLVLLANKKKF